MSLPSVKSIELLVKGFLMTWAGFLGFNSKFRVPSLTREAGGHVIVTSASVHTILTES